MLHCKSLAELMNIPLPTKTEQRRQVFRPGKKEVIHTFKLLNETIFDNLLAEPNFNITRRKRNLWAECVGDTDVKNENGSMCEIRLPDKWYCPQWMAVILAHELCHQHQFEITGPKLNKIDLMSHGPTFFQFRDRLKEFGIPLKRQYSSYNWFATQNFFKI